MIYGLKTQWISCFGMCSTISREGWKRSTTEQTSGRSIDKKVYKLVESDENTQPYSNINFIKLTRSGGC